MGDGGTLALDRQALNGNGSLLTVERIRLPGTGGRILWRGGKAKAKADYSR